MMLGFWALCVLWLPSAGPIDSHGLSARLVLLGAIADGLDGVLARRYGHSAIGAMLDSVVDVVTFGIAPGVLVVSITGRSVDPLGIRLVLYGLATAYAVSAVVRTAIYTTDTASGFRRGVPNTLGGLILTGIYVAGIRSPTILAALAGLFAYLMVVDTPYPGLRPTDAVGAGAIQTLAIVLPSPYSRWLAWVLVVCALAYLFGGPRLYQHRGISK